MERQSWCSHQSPVPIPLLFIILAATDTLLQVRRLSLFLSPDYSTLLFPSRRYARCIGKAQRPSSDEATFPSIRPRIRPCRSSIVSIDSRIFRKNFRSKIRKRIFLFLYRRG